MAEGVVSRTIELSSLPPSSLPLPLDSATLQFRRNCENAPQEREKKRGTEKKKKNEEREVGVIRARAFLFF